MNQGRGQKFGYIFNILLVLGLAGAITPLEVLLENLIDGIILSAISIVVWIFAWRSRQNRRAEGAVMVAMYAVYMGYICIR